MPRSLPSSASAASNLFLRREAVWLRQHSTITVSGAAAHRIALRLPRCFTSSSSYRRQHVYHRAFSSYPASASASASAPAPTNPLNPIAVHRATAASAAREARRRRFALTGALGSMLATAVLVFAYELHSSPPARSEAPPPVATPASQSEAVEGGDIKHNLRVTGTSTVPFFPRTIHLPRSASASASSGAPTPALPAGTALPPSLSSSSSQDELVLLGLGIRTVSFLAIQVYVAGLYVSTADLARIQARMIREAAPPDAPGASALVAGEKEALRQKLLDPVEGLELWNRVLREEGVRSAVRVVPVRTTDFAHLRDGWVRGLTARSGSNIPGGAAAAPGLGGERFDDEAFGEAVAEFKGLFGGKGRVAKGRVLLLEREQGSGNLVAWVERDADKPVNKTDQHHHHPQEEEEEAPELSLTRLGSVSDERISRLIWLGYLGGKTVSSEGLRQDVVQGVLDLVERPVGTVEAQVV